MGIILFIEVALRFRNLDTDKSAREKCRINVS